MVQFLRRRCFEGMNLDALRIDARHDVFDDAVLAGRIHRLDDHQHRPAILRVEHLLPLGQSLDVLRHALFQFVLVEIETAGIAGIDAGQAELAGLVDAEALDDLGEVHRLSSVQRGRKPSNSNAATHGPETR